MASPAPAASSDRASALARLVEAQAADARCFKCSGTHEADLAGFDDPSAPVLDRIADPRQPEPHAILEAIEAIGPKPDPAGVGIGQVNAGRRAGNVLGIRLTGLNEVWQVKHTRYDGKSDCPSCSGLLPRDTVCIVCGASTDDPTRHPMVMVMTVKVARRAAVRTARTAARGTAKAKAGKGPRQLVGGLGEAPCL